MESIKMIMASRQADRNPFREILEKMGAFGGPTLGDMSGAQTPQPRPTLAPEAGGQQLQQLVKMLIAKGVPQAEAVEQAKGLIRQRMMTGGAA